MNEDEEEDDDVRLEDFKHLTVAEHELAQSLAQQVAQAVAGKEIWRIPAITELMLIQLAQWVDQEEVKPIHFVAAMHERLSSVERGTDPDVDVALCRQIAMELLDQAKRNADADDTTSEPEQLLGLIAIVIDTIGQRVNASGADISNVVAGHLATYEARGETKQ